MEYITHYEEQTKSVGRQLATMISPGDIITLSGDLGAGKTTFTKGFAEGLGVKETITSPTFSLMNVYPTNTKSKIETFVHIDTYRLENQEELR
ncbi:MAG: tRNA (adenosine(37)-N6)-threonylcarbamoyltransferase complex ATPase subunit type 1 TsaE, partial [Candidatus Magasanikbacteria bacterium CG1_02_41_34]